MLVKNSGTWNRIVRDAEGYIYNDFRTQFPGDSPTWKTSDFNVLHRVSCSRVKMMTYVAEGKLTEYLFQSRKEAMEWLEMNREKTRLYSLFLLQSLKCSSIKEMKERNMDV